MKKLIFLTFLLFSFSANAEIIRKDTPTCKTAVNLDILNSAIKSRNIELSVYLYVNELCSFFPIDVQVKVLKRYAGKSLIRFWDYDGYVFNSDLS